MREALASFNGVAAMGLTVIGLFKVGPGRPVVFMLLAALLIGLAVATGVTIIMGPRPSTARYSELIGERLHVYDFCRRGEATDLATFAGLREYSAILRNLCDHAFHLVKGFARELANEKQPERPAAFQQLRENARDKVTELPSGFVDELFGDFPKAVGQLTMKGVLVAAGDGSDEWWAALLSTTEDLEAIGARFEDDVFATLNTPEAERDPRKAVDKARTACSTLVLFARETFQKAKELENTAQQEAVIERNKLELEWPCHASLWHRAC